MKPRSLTFILFFLIISHTSWCQQSDSLIVYKQVDSLIKVSRDFATKKDFAGALEMNAIAEKIALAKLGRESAGYGSCCFNRGRINYQRKEYGEAEKWYQEAIAIQEKALGKGHPVYANSLNSLAILYYNGGKYEKVEPLLLDVIAIRGKELGKDHPDYIKSITFLGLLYKDKRNFEKAEPLFFEAKAIQEKTLGIEHPDYARTINSLAGLYLTQGKYDKAEPLYLEAKAIQEKTHGKEHPDFAKCVANLAELYREKGNFEKAELFYLEALAIRKKAVGEDHPEYASTLNSLGILYYYMGKFEKAEPLYLEARAIQEKVLGKEHPDFTRTSNNLAGLYVNMGAYEKAEPLYLEAKAIQEKLLGKEYPEYAGYLQNLGDLYINLGNFEKAEAYFLEANSTWEKLVGKEHPQYALSAENLGDLYMQIGKYEKAESLFLEAMAIQEKVLGKEHPDYSGSLQNLGNLYSEIGEFSKAEQLYLRALVIQEKTLGKEHLNYIGSLQNLGNLYSKMGEFRKAEPLYLQALAIQKKVLGKEHPSVANSLSSLAKIERDMDKYAEAELNYHELALLNQTLLQKAVHHLSEHELGSYLRQFSIEQDQVLSFVHQSGRKSLAASCYDNSLFFKGFLLQASAQLKLLPNSDTASAEKFNLLKSYGRRLAFYYSQPVAERDSNAVAILESKSNDLEKDLTRIVAGFGNVSRQVKWHEVRSALKPGEAAIEFAYFQNDERNEDSNILYSALLIRPGDEQPVFISLFEEKQLSSILNPGNNARNSELLAQVYSRGVKPLQSKEMAGLYELIWKPLDSLLSNTHTIYLSPAGLLHRINFNAIPMGQTRLLSDKYRFVELGSTRSLVVPDLIKSDLTNRAVLFGGIHYQIDTTAIARDSSGQKPLAEKPGELLFSYVDRSISQRGGNWNYLPGTQKEVDQINTQLKKANFSSQVFSGEVATEEIFKSLGQKMQSPRILHIATHGYFFPDAKVETKENNYTEREPIFKISDHPMIRSGLILAGGNYAWKTGKPLQEGTEDGILTAYEISQMNLSNTELVVLSACETGLGDIQGNEGVYGLQRAFKIAGAKYLMMSLWQVPDDETSVFMTAFYKHWLEDKQTIPEAFHNTQSEMRKRFENPYQWAGFVLVE